MSTENYQDITKTGPQNYRDLQKANNKAPKYYSEEAAALFKSAASADRRAVGNLGTVGYTEDYYGVGKSKYDKDILTPGELRDVNDNRALEQGWYTQIANGAAKGLVLAGTTWANGTAGLVWGAIEYAYKGIADGEWSGNNFWNNALSQKLDEINQWSEEVLPNYRTEQAQNQEWYKNIFSGDLANTIGNDFLKNMGFSIGAAYGGMTFAPLLRGMSKLMKLGSGASLQTQMMVGSTLSAFGEASIEASHTHDEALAKFTKDIESAHDDRLAYIETEEFMEEATKKAQDDYNQKYKEINERYDKMPQTLVNNGDGVFVNPTEQARKKELDKLNADYISRVNNARSIAKKEANDAYDKAMQRAKEDAIKVGNGVFAMNIGILATSNYFAFGKAMVGGWKPLSKIEGVSYVNSQGERTSVKQAAKGAASKAAEAGTAVDAEEFAKQLAKGSYNVDKMGKGEKFLKSTVKPFLREANEEWSQGAAGKINIDYYGTDVMNYYKSNIDEDAELETLSYMNSIINGIDANVKDSNSWFEFLIGGVTGLTGVPIISKQKGKWGLRMQGGVREELQNIRENEERAEKIVGKLNEWIQDPKNLNNFKGINRINFFSNLQKAALEVGDEKAFKDAEFASMFSGVQMFSDAGRLDDFYTILDFLDSADQASPEELAEIVKDNTRTVTIEEQREAIKEELNTIYNFLNNNKKALSIKQQNVLNKRAEKLSRKLLTPGEIQEYNEGQFAGIDINTEEGQQKAVDILQKNSKQMREVVDAYLDSKSWVDNSVGDRLSNDQANYLAFLRAQALNWEKRIDQMGDEVQKALKPILDNNIEEVQELERYREVLEAQGVKDPELDKTIAQIKFANEEFKSLLRGTASRANRKLSDEKWDDFRDGIAKYLEHNGAIFDEFEYKDILKKLEDMKALSKATKLFSDTVKEYSKNLDKLEDDIEQTKKDTATEKENKTEEEKVNKAASQSVNEKINEVIDNSESWEDIDTSAFDEFVEMGDEAFDDTTGNVSTEKQEAIKRSRKAKEILEKAKNSKKRLDDMRARGQIDEQTHQDALALLLEGLKNSEAIEDLDDLDREAFNNFENLPNRALDPSMTEEEIEALMGQRLDKAKTAIREALDEEKATEKLLENVPGTVERGPVEGRVGAEVLGEEKPSATDPVEQPAPVNAIQRTDAYDAFIKAVNNDIRAAKEQGLITEAEEVRIREMLNNIVELLAQKVSNNNLKKTIQRKYGDLFSNNYIKDLYIVFSKHIPKFVDASLTTEDIADLKLPTSTKPEIVTGGEQATQEEVTGVESIPEELLGEEIDKIHNDDKITNSQAQADEDAATGALPLKAANGTLNYWRPATTEYPIHRKRGGDRTPYWMTLDNSNEKKPIYKAVYEFLEKVGVFDRAKTGFYDRAKGPKVTFAISKELSKSAGVPVILIVNSSGEVIGDLPIETDRYPGLAEFTRKAVKEYNEKQESVEGDLVPVGGESTIAKIMVGKPDFTTNKRSVSLNQIMDNTNSQGQSTENDFMIGFSTSNGQSPVVVANSKKSRDPKLQSTIMRTSESSTAPAGTPYLLLPTSSDLRAYMPVPFSMPRWLGISEGSLIYKAVREVAEYMATLSQNSDKKDIHEAQDRLRALLNLNHDKGIITFSKDGKLLGIRNGEKIAWASLESASINTRADIIMEAIKKHNPSIRVAREHINNTITVNGQEVNYNRMIGEVAFTNMRPGANHTVDDWFVLNPIIDGQEKKAKAPKTIGTNPNQRTSTATHVDVDANTRVKIENGDYYVWDAVGNDYLLLDPTKPNHAILRAKAYGIQHGLNGQKEYDTPWGRFNTKEEKFVAPKVESAPAEANTEGLGAAVDAARQEADKIPSEAFGTPISSPTDAIDTEGLDSGIDKSNAEGRVGAEYLNGGKKVVEAKQIGNEIARKAGLLKEGEVPGGLFVLNEDSSNDGGDLNYALAKSLVLRIRQTILRANSTREELVRAINNNGNKTKANVNLIEFMAQVQQAVQNGTLTVQDATNIAIQYLKVDPATKNKLFDEFNVEKETTTTTTTSTSNTTRLLEAAIKLARLDDINITDEELLNNDSIIPAVLKTELENLKESDLKAYRETIKNIRENAKNLQKTKAVNLIKSNNEAIFELLSNWNKLSDATTGKVEQYLYSKMPEVHKALKVLQKQTDKAKYKEMLQRYIDEAKKRQENKKNSNNVIPSGSAITADNASKLTKDSVVTITIKSPRGDSEFSDTVAGVSGNYVAIYTIDGGAIIVDVNAGTAEGFSEAQVSLKYVKEEPRDSNSADEFNSFSHTLSVRNTIFNDPNFVNVVDELSKGLENLEGTEFTDALYDKLAEHFNIDVTKIKYDEDIIDSVNSAYATVVASREKAATELKTTTPAADEAATDDDGGEVLSADDFDFSMDIAAERAKQKAEKEKAKAAEAKKDDTQDAYNEALKSLRGKINATRKLTFYKVPQDIVIAVSKLNNTMKNRFFATYDATINSSMSEEDIQKKAREAYEKSSKLRRESSDEAYEGTDIEAEVARVQQMLPQLAHEDALRLVESVTQLSTLANGDKVWGLFKDGVVYLAKNSSRGTAYHEAFHYVSQTLLSDRELSDLYEEAARVFGQKSELELEEELAEGFRRYMQNYEQLENQKGFRKLWGKLKMFVKTLFGKEAQLNKLYRNIRKGKFANKSKATNTINTYHGTGAFAIDEFSTDFLFTGEGNTAYTSGFYFTGSKVEAQMYRIRALATRLREYLPKAFTLFESSGSNLSVADMVDALNTFSATIKLGQNLGEKNTRLFERLTKFFQQDTQSFKEFVDLVERLSSRIDSLESLQYKLASIQKTKGILGTIRRLITNADKLKAEIKAIKSSFSEGVYSKGKIVENKETIQLNNLARQLSEKYNKFVEANKETEAFFTNIDEAVTVAESLLKSLHGGNTYSISINANGKFLQLDTAPDAETLSILDSIKYSLLPKIKNSEQYQRVIAHMTLSGNEPRVNGKSLLGTKGENMTPKELQDIFDNLYNTAETTMDKIRILEGLQSIEYLDKGSAGSNVGKAQADVTKLLVAKGGYVGAMHHSGFSNADHHIIYDSKAITINRNQQSREQTLRRSMSEEEALEQEIKDIENEISSTRDKIKESNNRLRAAYEKLKRDPKAKLRKGYVIYRDGFLTPDAAENAIPEEYKDITQVDECRGRYEIWTSVNKLGIAMNKESTKLLQRRVQLQNMLDAKKAEIAERSAFKEKLESYNHAKLNAQARESMDYLKERGMTIEDFEKMTLLEKETFLKCRM
jgi:hypothetical protein